MAQGTGEAPPARCESCGGLNDPSAEWCGQCFARFRPLPEPLAPVETSGNVLLHAAAGVLASNRLMPVDDGHDPVMNQVIGVTDGRPTWMCVSCRRKNPNELDSGSLCGTSFSDSARKVTAVAAKEDVARTLDRASMLVSPAGLLSPLTRLGPWGFVLGLLLSLARLFRRRRR